MSFHTEGRPDPHPPTPNLVPLPEPWRVTVTRRYREEC